MPPPLLKKKDYLKKERGGGTEEGVGVGAETLQAESGC